MHDCLETVVMANRGKQRCLSEVMSIGKPAGLGGGGGSFPMPNSGGQRLRVAWERQGYCLSSLHPIPVHQAWTHQGLFWQVFMQKRCEDVLGPDPKVVLTLASDWTAQ